MLDMVSSYLTSTVRIRNHKGLMNHDQFLHPVGQNNSWERLGRSRLKATEVGSL